MNFDLLLALPDPSFLFDTAGIILGANSAAAELLGTSLDRLVGQSVLGLVVNPETVTRHFLNLASRTRQALPGALTWKHQDGTLIETRCDGSVVQPRKTDADAIVYVRCRLKQESVTEFMVLNNKIRDLSMKIQERRKAEIALYRSEERYRTLVGAISTVVWYADLEGSFKEVQPSWSEYTGQNREEYFGWGYLQAIHLEDRSRVETCWRDCLQGGNFFDCELRLWSANSKAYHLCLSRAAPVRDEKHRIREWVGTITDIEETKKLEDQLRQTQKLESLGVLAGGVAHDFNNLLVGILGNASLALETISTNNPARAMLRDVVSASETAAHLTKQLLAYTGKGRFVLEPSTYPN
jgi:PAS domain S-box-containing protein